MNRMYVALWVTLRSRRDVWRLLLLIWVSIGTAAACSRGESGQDAETDARLTTRGAGDLLSGGYDTEGFSAIDPGRPGLAGVLRQAPPGSTPERITIDSLGVDFGSLEAPLRLVEFFDYGCGYCRLFHQNTRALLHEQYVDSGLIYWKALPFITGNWANSVPVTLAAECARDQGRDYFEAISGVIFERQRDWKAASAPEDLADGFAEEVGLDMERYRTCFEDDELLWRVQAQTSFAGELDVNGTPTLFVVGVGPLVGALPLEAFQQMFDTVLVVLAAQQP